VTGQDWYALTLTLVILAAIVYGLVVHVL